MTCKASLQLLLRIPSCKLWWFYYQRSEQVLVNHLKLSVLTLFEWLIRWSILWDNIISVPLIPCLWLQVNLLSYWPNWLVIFFHGSILRLRCLAKLGSRLCLCHGVKLFIFKCIFGRWQRCGGTLLLIFHYHLFMITKLRELVDNAKKYHEMRALFDSWNHC